MLVLHFIASRDRHTATRSSDNDLLLGQVVVDIHLVLVCSHELVGHVSHIDHCWACKRETPHQDALHSVGSCSRALVIHGKKLECMKDRSTLRLHGHEQDNNHRLHCLEPAVDLTSSQ